MAAIGTGDVAWRRALTSVLPGGPVLVVGEGSRKNELVRSRPDTFLVDRQATQPTGVLALGTADATLAAAVEASAEPGPPEVLVWIDSAEDPPLATEQLRHLLGAAGLLLVASRRVVFGEGSGGGSRAERLGAETRELLVRCVRLDDPRAAEILAEELARSERELEVYRELEVEHARTREAERQRARQLEELEAELGRYRAGELAAEVERLRGELERLHATRLLRVGRGWWALRERLRVERRPRS